MPASKPKVEIRCGVCGKPFWVLPSRIGKRLYCSTLCGKAGGNRKRSEWGNEHRRDSAYKQAQRDRTKVSWQDPNIRETHLAAMRTPAYRAVRSANMKRITASANWRTSIAEYKASGKARKRCVGRRMPNLPNWQTYVDANGCAHRFRSTWEKALARYLDIMGLAWEFEPRKFVFDDNSSYTPDFRVESPFGVCYLECHRIEHVKPGDEEKVMRLHRIASGTLLDAPLILLGEREISRILRVVGMRRKASGPTLPPFPRADHTVPTPRILFTEKRDLPGE